MAPQKGAPRGKPASGPPRRRPEPPDTATLPSPTGLHRVALASIFALALVLSLRQAGSPDLGFHLRTGEYILEGHGFPRTDPFTETLRTHRYTDTSWGYDVLVALLYRLGGAPALVFAHAVLILLVLGVLYRTTRLAAGDPTTLTLALLAGVIAMETRFEVRPEIVSYAFLTVLLHVLHRYALGLPVRLWALPLLMLGWSNLHSLYVLGWAVMAAFVVGLWLARNRFDTTLARWCLAAILVAVLNPYGWRAIAFPFTLLTRFGEQNPFAQTIGEFVSPFALGTFARFPFYPELPIWTYRVLALLSLVSLTLLARRGRWWTVLVGGIVLGLSARMLRNVPLFVIGLLPALVWTLPLEGWLGWLGMSRRVRIGLARGCTLFAVLFALGLGLRVVHDAYYVDARRPERFGLGWSTTRLPVETAAYLKSAHLSGTMLNDLNLGGYLMWAQPAPVFIDGRLEVVGESFYRYYLDVFHSESALEACVTQRHVGWIVFPYLENMELLRRLSQDSRWTLAHVDPVAVVFARTSANPLPPAALELPPRSDPATLPGLAGHPRAGRLSRWLYGFVAHQTFPFEVYQRGLFHTIRREMEPAAGWLAESIRQSNGAYYEIYLSLAQVLDQLGQRDLARRAFRVVLEEDPTNRIALRRIGG